MECDVDICWSHSFCVLGLLLVDFNSFRVLLIAEILMYMVLQLPFATKVFSLPHVFCVWMQLPVVSQVYCASLILSCLVAAFADGVRSFPML